MVARIQSARVEIAPATLPAGRHLGTSRYFWLQAGALLLGVGVFCFLLLKLDTKALVGSIGNLVPVLPIAAALHFLALLLMGSAWYLLLQTGGEKPGSVRVVLAYAWAHALNEITPVRSSGDLVAGALLCKKSKVDTKRMLASVMLQNVVAVFSVVVAAVVFLFLCMAGGAAGDILWPMAGAAAILSFLTVLLVLSLRHGAAEIAVRLVGGFGARKRWDNDRWKRDAREIDRSVWKMAQNRGTMGAVVALWITVRVVQLFETFLLVDAMVPGLHAPKLLLISAGVQAGAMLVMGVAVFVPGQVGAAEGSSAAVMAMFGLAPAVGVALELGRRILRLAAIAFGICCGMWLNLSRDERGRGMEVKHGHGGGQSPV